MKIKWDSNYGLAQHDTSRSASLSSPQTISLPLPLSADSQSFRLNSTGSDQETDGLNATGNTSERKKTLEERMNEMVDAVFGQPKNELLKLIQRSPPSSNPVASCPATEELTQQTSTEMTGGIVDVDSQSRHDFQETNSFRPCTCAHCNGLVNCSTTILSLITSSLTAIFSFIPISSSGDHYVKDINAESVASPLTRCAKTSWMLRVDLKASCLVPLQVLTNHEIPLEFSIVKMVLIEFLWNYFLSLNFNLPVFFIDRIHVSHSFSNSFFLDLSTLFGRYQLCDSLRAFRYWK